MYTAISIKVVHEQSGKVEYERERLMGIANKLMNFHSDSQQPFALVFDFSALLVYHTVTDQQPTIIYKCYGQQAMKQVTRTLNKYWMVI
jgi:hypothetical protein